MPASRWVAPRAWTLALPALGASCGFFDPLDQSGLRVVMEPPDTAVYVGASFQAHAQMVNSYADRYPSDHIRYAGLGASIAVEPAGTVSGLAYGRVSIVATRGHLADTGWVSVVPMGTLALSLVSDVSTVDITNVDGSAFRSVIAAGQYNGGAPAWLPGDAGLVYQYAIPGGAGGTQVFVTDLAGNSRMLASAGKNPRASRDGIWVYYEHDGVIWRLHPDGTAREQVTGGGDYYPDPSPDGTRLTYASTRFALGEFRLTVRDLASGAERQLGIQALWPRWDPTGDSLAYWSGDPNTGRGTIHVIGADGNGGYQASPTGRLYTSSGLDWSPDGRWLLARTDTTLDVIQVATGTALPLGYATHHHLASWRW